MYDQAAADWQRIADERERQLRAQAEILRHTKQELEAARLVCVLFGWTASAGDSDEDKAVAQAWHDWANTYGAISPTPEWRARVKELARRRDEIRQRTLASIRGARSAEERSDDTKAPSKITEVG